ncbi:thioredoxin [Putridiphycobacter roseus]|uniref:Thioredoxin n=1 Tax=Putridiphycobacter roseus TaxID=2219161 RepID=A0A2W1N085_9FLAO|nr:DUF255 domain-containing protein [Putridiphycobacter roseus]PZE17617.1 thioredoxin [Putridiphycobacter roseus]
MKKYLIAALVFGAVACGASKGTSETTSKADAKPKTEVATQNVITQAPRPVTIEWLDFETAIERNKKEPKYIFIDIYTEWCGWCKKMDASTFLNPEVMAYMNTHFYAVKMDAESKEPIAYNGNLYEYKQYNARAGYNTLSVSLLGNQMSFPSFVILDKKEAKKGKIMGYKEPVAFLKELKTYVK